MKRVVPFALVAAGTVGLLVGEFVDIGRPATLILAGVNLVGLVGVGFVLLGSRS